MHVHSVPQWNGEIESVPDHYFAGAPALTIGSLSAAHYFATVAASLSLMSLPQRPAVYLRSEGCAPMRVRLTRRLQLRPMAAVSSEL